MAVSFEPQGAPPMNTRILAVAIIALAAPAVAFTKNTSNAPSAASGVSLPKNFLGSWCGMPDESPTSETTYTRGKCKDENGKIVEYADGKMTLKANVISYWESGCTFSSIVIRKETYYPLKGRPEATNVYEAKGQCGGEGEEWGGVTFLQLNEDGDQLLVRSFEDYELPREFHDKTVCQFDTRTYFELADTDDGCKGISLRFERDRYTIMDGGMTKGFCRFSSVKTEWDATLTVATKTQGGPKTYITASCPKAQKSIAIYVSKGTLYVEDTGR
jgi:hypothetical protein